MEYDELVGEVCSQIKPESVGLYIQIAQQCMRNRDYNSASAVLDAIEMAIEKKQIKIDDMSPDERRLLSDTKESFKMHFDTSRVLINAGRDVIPVMRDDKNKEPLCGDNKVPTAYFAERKKDHGKLVFENQGKTTLQTHLRAHRMKDYSTGVDYSRSPENRSLDKLKRLKSQNETLLNIKQQLYGIQSQFYAAQAMGDEKEMRRLFDRAHQTILVHERSIQSGVEGVRAKRHLGDCKQIEKTMKEELDNVQNESRVSFRRK